MTVFDKLMVLACDITDPREGICRHKLTEIIAIALCAVISGADSWRSIALYAKLKEDWLKSFLELPYGVPSYSTFGRVISGIAPAEFVRLLHFITEEIRILLEPQSDPSLKRVVSIDGKTSRGSHKGAKGSDALHLVNVFDSRTGLCLGQEKVDGKTNEITVIPRVLELFDVEGAIVTIDAMGCQKEITSKVRSQGADYLLAIKENHKELFQSITQLFEEVTNPESLPQDVVFTTVEKGHGRIETRTCVSIPKVPVYGLSQDWKDLASFTMVDSTREIGEKITKERRYYISSLQPDPRLQLSAAREHWGIENRLHWCLDVTFREDASRIREHNGPENMSALRKTALNILKKDKNKHLSNKLKSKKAGWDNSYLTSLLFQSTVLE